MQSFYLKNHVNKEKKIYNITITKCDDLTSKKNIMVIEKVTIKKVLSTLNKRNIAFSKKKATTMLHYIPKVRKKEGHSSNV